MPLSVMGAIPLPSDDPDDGRHADAAAPSPAPRHAALARPALVLLAFFVLSVCLFANVWQSPFQRLIGLPGDPGIFLWYLRWPGFALSHGLNPLFTDYLDAPTGVNLMWNTSIPLPALLLTPLTSTLGLAFSYNLLQTLAVALSGWTAFLAIRGHVKNDGAAAAGAVLYAFSPYLVSQVQQHVQTSLVMLLPLFMIVLEQIAIRQRWRPMISGAALGLLATAQLLMSEEILAITVLAAALGLATLAGMYPSRIGERSRYALRAAGWAAATALTLSGLPLAMQLFGPQRISGAVQPNWVYSNDLLNFIVPTPVQLLDPAALRELVSRFTGNIVEWDAYLGIPLLALIILVAVRHWKKPAVRLATGMIVLLAPLSLGSVLHVGGIITGIPVVLLAGGFLLFRHGLPGKVMAAAFAMAWVTLAIVPLWNDLLPGRIMLPVFLLAGFLLAVFVEQAVRDRRWTSVAARAALVMAIMLTLFPKVPYPQTSLAVPPFFLPGGTVAKIPAGQVSLVVPFSRGGEATAMVWQAASGMRFRMPEGYVYVPTARLWEISPPPSATQSLLASVAAGSRPAVSSAVRAQVLTELERWQVRTIIVGPMPHENEAVADLAAIVGHDPTASGGVFLWDLSAAAG
jgi:hypothetical protein